MKKGSAKAVPAGKRTAAEKLRMIFASAFANSFLQMVKYLQHAPY